MGQQQVNEAVTTELGREEEKAREAGVGVGRVQAEHLEKAGGCL